MKPLPINMEAASGLPFYRQITDQVTDLIRMGWVEKGERLPSVRDLAGQLLVSVITVRRAYSEMERSGLIESRQGSGTFVSDNVAPATRARALRDARRILKDAVVVARRLGMDDGMQLALMKSLLSDGEYRG